MPQPTHFSLTIQGHNPAPQGSKAYKGHRYNARAGRALPVLVEESQRVKPWRTIVAMRGSIARIQQHITQPMDGILQADLVFVMQPSQTAQRQIASNPGTVFPITRSYGDIDKLQRSTFDGLADAHVIHDDARIVRVTAIKIFPGTIDGLDQPGLRATISHMDPTTLGA